MSQYIYIYIERERERDPIKMNLREIGCTGMKMIQLAQDVA
jgi:hypothetical protein